MATTYVGNDGDVAGLTCAKLNAWQATISRVQHDITGFSDAGRVRKLGLIDITGSASGIAESGTTTGPHFLQTNRTGATVTLFVFQATNTNDCSVQFNAVIGDVAYNVSKTGDAGVSFSFALSADSTNVYTKVWQSS